eukprot:TRINITY_DN55610_c0_g1_i1.p1 TRINITY_DN55610_c0_g1~~TRINITY_DN55610_c0_g1_i1.p1  ORF type:complete len:607 (-),score=71.47 TRINITY_DN55610_c0_g1_i1:177-1997(-)
MYGATFNGSSPAPSAFFLARPPPTSPIYPSPGPQNSQVSHRDVSKQGGIETPLVTQSGPNSACNEAAKTVRERLPDFLLPWAMFSLVLLPCGLMEDPFLGNMSVVATVLLSVAFLCLSQDRPWRVLACMCMFSVFFALLTAMYAQENYLDEYKLIKQSRWYSNVRPDENPVAKNDASVITFSDDTFVDVTRSVGLKSGEVFCVAPIVSDEEQTSAGYWAIGTDCCKPRGGFNCGDIWGKTKSSVVLSDLGTYNSNARLDDFKRAMRASAAVYQLAVPRNPTFVSWTADVDGYMFATWMSGLFLVLAVVLIFFCIALAVGIVISLFGDVGFLRELRLKGDVPHRHQLQCMRFGPDFPCCGWQPEADSLLDEQLRFQRPYWCGEVIHDYIFHVCNVHLFVGIFGCHPHHPFARLPRFVVALCIGVLVVFPAAAISAVMGGSFNCWLRLLLIACIVSVPRNLIRSYLRLSAGELRGNDSSSEIKRLDQPRSKRLGLILVAVACVLAVCVCCTSMYIIADTGLPLGRTLLLNTHGVGFALVIEVLMDLFYPHLEKSPRGSIWAVGFFGSWIVEQKTASLNQHDGLIHTFDPVSANHQRHPNQFNMSKLSL